MNLSYIFIGLTAFETILFGIVLSYIIMYEFSFFECFLVVVVSSLIFALSGSIPLLHFLFGLQLYTIQNMGFHFLVWFFGFYAWIFFYETNDYFTGSVITEPIIIDDNLKKVHEIMYNEWIGRWDNE